MDLTRAVVEDHTTRIDRFHTNTGDKSYFQGHYYSDKLPGLSLLAAPVYAAYLGGLRLWFGAAEARQQADTRPFRSLYLASLATIALPSAIASTAFFLVSARLIHDLFKALFATVAYGLGSLAFPYSTLFFGHQLSGSLLFVAFASLFYERRREHAPTLARWRWPMFVAGLAAGYSVVTEFSAALPALLLGVYAATAPSMRRMLYAFLAGGLLAATILAAYNWVSFRSPFAFGYSFLVDPRFANGMNQGFMGLTFPKPDVLYQIVFGFYRGLLPLSPVMAVAAIGGWRMWKEQSARPELIVGGSIVAFYLFFNSSYIFWDGGWSFGPRHVVPMLAFLSLPIAFGIGARPLMAGGLLALSVLHMLLGTVFSPLVPTEFSNTLFDYIYPRILHGFGWNDGIRNWGMILGLSGHRALLPLLAIWAAAVVISGIHIAQGPSGIRRDLPPQVHSK